MRYNRLIYFAPSTRGAFLSQTWEALRWQGRYSELMLVYTLFREDDRTTPCMDGHLASYPFQLVGTEIEDNVLAAHLYDLRVCYWDQYHIGRDRNSRTPRMDAYRHVCETYPALRWEGVGVVPVYTID